MQCGWTWRIIVDCKNNDHEWDWRKMVYYFLYFLGSILVATALGLAAMDVRGQAIPQAAKFFLGFSITPVSYTHLDA